jgi:hypothetical protein
LLKLQEAADLSALNIKRIKQAIDQEGLRVTELGVGTGGRRILLGELHKWWARKTTEEIAPI